MIIVENRRYITAEFSSEAELEQVVVDNAEYIFGPETIYLPKALIRSAEGSGTVPDGFVVDLSERRWFLVEAELGSHSVWSHIAPQVAKQLIAARQPSVRQQLVETMVTQVKEDPTLREKFADLDIAEIDIRRVVTEIFETAPVVGLPIDRIKPDLREWAETVNADVKLWEIRKLVDFEDSSRFMYEFPDEYRPALDTTSPDSTGRAGRAYYDATLSDLVESGLLAPGAELSMSYTPRDGSPHTFSAVVSADGALVLDGRSFASPSYAALHGIQSAGSDRKTVNGWTSWRTTDGILLSVLRERYLQAQEDASGDSG